jgi:hypothetical protein
MEEREWEELETKEEEDLLFEALPESSRWDQIPQSRLYRCSGGITASIGPTAPNANDSRRTGSTG